MNTVCLWSAIGRSYGHYLVPKRELCNEVELVCVLGEAQTAHTPPREVAHDEIVDRIRYRAALATGGSRRSTGAD